MISVIIPTRNRSNLLAQALQSIVYQRLESSLFEVLVVDNGSSDSTPDVIEFYKGKMPNLIGIYAPEPGLHNGRHAGMQRAKGEILVFADDDIEALPTWLESISEAFQDSGVAMVGGNNYPYFLEEPPRWLRRLWERSNCQGYYSIPSLSVIEFVSAPTEISPHLVWGCNFSIRKEILLEAGGFHPDGMPQELIRFRGDGETYVSSFVENSKMKCVFHPGASVYHKVTPERMTIRYFYQRGFNQGVSDSFTRLRESQLGASTISHKVGFFLRAFNFVIHKKNEFLGGRELNCVLAEFKKGYKAGFDYHQNLYRDDPEVRDWVHRFTYY
ncbi:glycosyltransferase family 2 protein [Metapseudomonas otitidis]|uniref:glycosyltransferase family 2 protein n=1 Tax=Pseudomonadaceae TaxID=135621 RepID=UPI0009F32D94|nr:MULTISPECIES: glycosyltransferase family 2 protein [Pseudomonas]